MMKILTNDDESNDTIEQPDDTDDEEFEQLKQTLKARNAKRKQDYEHARTQKELAEAKKEMAVLKK